MILSILAGLALPGVLLVAPPTNGMEFGGVTIPGTQAQPPAGHDDIAFRPACGQVGAIFQANGLNAYTIPLPDGSLRTLVEMPPMPPLQAHKEMDSSGLCKVGGVIVPILFADQVPQPSIARVTGSVNSAASVATVDVENGGWPLWPLGLGALAIAALGTAAYWHYQQPASATSPPIVTPPPAADVENTPEPAAAPVATTDNLIDQLWG